MIEARAVENAARALLLGWDPIAFLAIPDGYEREIADAVIYRAIEIKNEETSTYFKNMAIAVQAGVARAFG